MSLSHLNVAELPLTGRHLIEASAGTGKTFNITRIYLRFLLEMRLPVQQILVMTFTKAATEEIRGRIAATLREALAFWQVANQQGLPEKADPVMASVYRAVPGEEGIALLKPHCLSLTMLRYLPSTVFVIGCWAIWPSHQRPRWNWRWQPIPVNCID